MAKANSAAAGVAVAAAHSQSPVDAPTLTGAVCRNRPAVAGPAAPAADHFFRLSSWDDEPRLVTGRIHV